MDASAYFHNKKVTVMGLGLLGGVGDIAFLAENGADLIVTDLKSKAEAAPSLEKLKQFTNIRYTLGRHVLADFRNRDLIIKAPSTPLDSPYIAEAKKQGTPVMMWAALFSGFARDAGATLIGVTGTRGKTTVTKMLVAIARTAKKKVIEGGNVQGTALLPQLARLTKKTVVILELDSWKLQGFGEARISPQVAVFTTFYPDHLNYYEDSLERYLADKANIFLFQTRDDTLVLGKQCATTIIEKYAEKIESHTVIADEHTLPDDWTLQIPGLHNRYNAALALEAARALGIGDAVSRKVLETFAGVPGRLELVREITPPEQEGSIKICNDTTATTPEATLAALNALTENYGHLKPIILIMGGADKGLDMSQLIEKLPELKRVILLTGTGTEKLMHSLKKTENSNIEGPYDALEPAIAKAMELAEPDDLILFSPAFASFGMFKNEYDRGDQFNQLVQKL